MKSFPNIETAKNADGSRTGYATASGVYRIRGTT